MKKCVVFDFGGGTLDISVLSIERRKIEVKSTNGDTHCGGQDIDNLLLQYFIKGFNEEHDIDLSSNKRASARILKVCTELKI